MQSNIEQQDLARYPISQHESTLTHDIHSHTAQAQEDTYLNGYPPEALDLYPNQYQLGTINWSASDHRFTTAIGGRFTQANLNGTDLMLSDLSGAVFGDSHHQASLQGANLSSSLLNHARFDGCNLTNANLENSVARHASFNHANLTGADMRNAILIQSTFDGANLSNAHMERTDLRGANLSNAQNLSTAHLDNAVYDDSTVFPEGFDPEAHHMRRAS